MKKIFLYPILLFFAIFLFDKLLCIPQVRESGRRSFKAGQNVLLGMPGVWLEDIKKQKAGELVIPMLGSSRSDIFHEWKQIPISKDVWNKPYYFETRSSVKASEFFFNYLLLKGMETVGYKPDLLFLEFSEEMLNENNVYSYKTKWNELTLREDQLIDVFDAGDLPFKKEILNRLFFLSYNYHFNVSTAITNLVKGKQVDDDTTFIQLASVMNEKRQFTEAQIGYSLDAFPSDQYQARIIDYGENQRQLILNKFKISEVELGFLKKIIQYVEKHNIPTVIWEPKVHPYYDELRRKITGGKIFEKIQKEYVSPSSQNIKFVSLNVEPSPCRIYTDCSHVSPVCIPKMAETLLLTAKQIPNFKK